MEFEAYYAAIRSPLKDIKPEHTKRVADAIANGDEAWLKKVLENPQLQRSGQEGKVAGNMMYALTHWLVDGSGREDVAHKWMEVCGHTKDRAADMFVEQFKKNDLSSPLNQQRCLGLSTLIDIFSQRETSVPMACLEHMLDMKGSRATQDQINLILASILRLKHPDEPPTFRAWDGTETPVIELLWTVDSLDQLLPSIGHAYGRGRRAIEAQMVAGIHKHLDTNMLATVGGDLCRTWDMIPEWHGAGAGPKIWEANARSHPFPLMAILNWGPESQRHMEFVLSDGVDIDAKIDVKRLLKGGVKLKTLTADANDTKCTALELAIDQAQPGAVAWLIENGANCTQLTWSSDPEQKITPLQRAQKAADDGQPQGSPSKDVLAVLQSSIAKRAALDAIRELELDTTAPRL